MNALTISVILTLTIVGSIVLVYSAIFRVLASGLAGIGVS